MLINLLLCFTCLSFACNSLSVLKMCHIGEPLKGQMFLSHALQQVAKITFPFRFPSQKKK